MSTVRFFRGSRLVGVARIHEDRTLHELAEDEGISIPSNCTSGTCGTCMVRLMAGTVPVPDPLPPGLDEDVLEDGARLTCIGIPEGQVDIDLIPPL